MPRSSVAAGEIVAVMGPSGAGKSTLLGALAGLVRARRAATCGWVSGCSTPRRAARRTSTPVGARSRAARPGAAALPAPDRARERRLRAARARRREGVGGGARRTSGCRASGSTGSADGGPAQLSGGQQQRVAIARALATQPAAVLLDEPLTSLDPETAGDIRAMLHDQLAATHTTAVVATHDAVDAVSLAHRLVVVEDGRVTQAGPVRDVLASPATRFVAAVAGLNRVVGAARGRALERADGLDAARHPSRGEARRGGLPSDRGALRGRATVRGSRAAARDGRVARRASSASSRRPAGVRVRTADPDVAVDVTRRPGRRRSDSRPGAAVRRCASTPADGRGCCRALDSAGDADPPLPAR